MSQGHHNTIPMVDYLVLEPEGGAHLVANRCTSCGALYFDRRNACASCGARGFEQSVLSSTGRLRTFTIVHRAAPNVPAPYISAVIELDGGGVIKSNLVGVPCEASEITLGGPVELVTFGLGVDDDNTEAIGFGFSPQTSNGDPS
jgi:uncharacterized OB-fold protein